jgi:uncharacterized OsmC-like protein
MVTETTIQDQIINGVNVDRLIGAINAVTDKPALAKFNFRAKSRWLGGGHVRTTIKDFYGAGQEDTSRKEAFVLDGDEPYVLLGEDHGANAVEAVLHALACCLGTTFIYHAAEREVKIDELEMELDGDLDLQGLLGISRKVRNGYENVRVTFYVRSDAPQETLEELCKLAQRRSPVFDIVSNPVPVVVELRQK